MKYELMSIIALATVMAAWRRDSHGHARPVTFMTLRESGTVPFAVVTLSATKDLLTDADSSRHFE